MSEMDTRSLFFKPHRWIQTLYTKRAPMLRVHAMLNFNSTNLVVTGIGNIPEVEFQLTFVRGSYDWKVPGAPTNYLGYLAAHSAQSSAEFGDSPAFVAGGVSISETFFDDVWHRLQLGRPAEPAMSLQVGPIAENDGIDDEIIWDRSRQQFLFIVEAELTFVREEKGKVVKED